MDRIAAFFLLLAAACAQEAPLPAPGVAATIAPLRNVAPGDAVVVAAGDIADCKHLGDARATAAIVATLPNATVLTLGDNAYPSGSPYDFARCYDPTWGAFKARTRPSPGNHEGRTSGSSGYFSYFGVPQYYSFDLGGWHLVSIDSEIGIGEASPQIEWLKHDLDATAKPCILAYWHHPRWSSGLHGTQARDRGRLTGALWSVLAAHHATLVLNGHDHDYERFAPRDGIREIVAGTGGAALRKFDRVVAGSEVRVQRLHGVLVLTLHPHSYEWRFVGVDGRIHDESARDEPCAR
ncbi:MAG TPA: metallophosphoesterase [Thermoanaerobaculia bacterium]|nr:metallophosphoesterase [Thermoanaerobaculia bacterium]